MRRDETAEFIFDAISRVNGNIEQLRKFATSRYQAWKELEKEKSNVFEIKWMPSR